MQRLTRHRLAVIGKRQAHRFHVVIILRLLYDRDLGRERAVEIHDDLLRMKGVIVVGVVPIDRPRRYEAFLVGGGRISHRSYRRLLDLRVVDMQLAVFGDDAFPSIGDQEVIEQRVRIVPGRVQLEPHPVDIAHALGAQLLLRFFKEVVIRIPGFWGIFDFVPRLFDQRAPDVVRPHCASIGHGVIATPFLDAVVAECSEQCRFGVLRFLRLDDVADVDQLVVPGIQREDFHWVVREQVGDNPAGQGRDDLLAVWREGHEGIVDRIAAGLLVLLDNGFERHVLFFGETLDPPYRRGFRRSVRDIGAG